MGHPDELLELLHPDFRWTSHRGETFDRAAYLRANIGGALTWRRQEVDDLRIAIAGVAGVVWCVVTDEVEIDGRLLSFRMPVTQTWLREDGSWRCLAGHAGPLLD